MSTSQVCPQNRIVRHQKKTAPLLKGFMVLAAALFSLSMAQTSWADDDDCTVDPNEGQCVCHGNAGEICPSQSGVVSGHDCHLADFCCSNFPDHNTAPAYCNFNPDEQDDPPALDCSLINTNGVDDRFGKCNGCGDGDIDQVQGCCDPDDDPQGCSDPDNFCEECDDGSNVPGDGCDANCQLEQCGDGNLDPGEQCDPPAGGQCQFGCTDDCQCDLCGNGVVDPGEQCDDPNNPCCSTECAFVEGPCDDGNACTSGESCEAGECGSPTDTVVCEALDECHIPGTCNPADGECSNPTKPDNSPCSDDDSCTSDENCQEGVCVPGTPLNCDDGNECKADSCEEGDCTHTPVTPGLECNDDNICTVDDQCGGEEHAGECVGQTKNCDDHNVCTDDSCDSNADCNPEEEDCGCVHEPNEETVECYTGPEGTEDVGICHGGTRQCADGELGECEGEVTPGSDDNCDGVDDDCDGTPDDDYVPTSTQCGVGECASTGQLICVDGGTVDTCQPGSPTGDDTDCDGKDDDCDGTPDDGYVSEPTQCGIGACADEGSTSCVNGEVIDDCAPGDPSQEICDGIDNDCDEIVDNGGNALCDDDNSCTDDICNGDSGCSHPENPSCEPPSCPDRDEDGVCDDVDNCPDDFNPDQLDEDGDGIGAACDGDDSGQVGTGGLQLRGEGCGSSNESVEVPLASAMTGPSILSLGVLLMATLRRKSVKREKKE